MAYTAQTIHSGAEADGVSTKNAQDLATSMELIDTALAAAAAVAAPAAATAAALTGTLTGTVNGAITDITFNATWSSEQANEVNKNFKEFQAQLVKLLADIDSLRTAVTAITTAL